MKPQLLAPIAAQQLLLLGNVLAASDCGDGPATATITIANSGDISSLASACATVEASVYISAVAGDEINIDGIEVIQGGLYLENCAALACDEETVTKISSPTLKLVEGDVIFEGLVRLTELSFPALGEVKGAVLVQELSELDTLDASSLGSVGSLVVANVPQLYYLELDILQANDVSISGNGELVLQLNNANTNSEIDSNLISQLDIAGIGELRWASPNSNIVVENFSVHDSNISELPLVFSSIQSLNVSNNADITDLFFPADAAAQNQLISRLNQITIQSNGKLNMTTIRSVNWNGTDMLTWVWPDGNMDSVVLDGVIHNTFFQPLIDAHQTTTLENANSSSSRVLQNFNITSSAPAFHCEPIDEMRRHGVFPGKYSCNGDSVDIPSSAASIKSMSLSLAICLIVTLAVGQLVLL